MDLGHQLLVIGLYFLAMARVTRLINGDTILDPLRSIPMNKAHTARNTAKDARSGGQLTTATHYDQVARRWSNVLYFIECPWCVGMWICLLGAYPVTRIIGWPWWSFVILALAASHLIGVFAFAADTEEVDVEEASN